MSDRDSNQDDGGPLGAGVPQRRLAPRYPAGGVENRRNPPPPGVDFEAADETAEPAGWQPEEEPPPPRLSILRRIGLVPILIGTIAVLLLVAIGLGVAAFTGAFAPQATAVAQRAQPRIEITQKQTFGDWVYTCARLSTGTDVRCTIAQQLSDEKTRTPLFLWRIAQDGKGGLVSEWQTRSGVLVGRGIVLEAGTDKPVTVPFDACLPEGCRAVANLAPDMVDKLSKADKASATIFPVGETAGVKLTLSVKGLGDALAALRK